MSAGKYLQTILEERGSRYGSFVRESEITINIKRAMQHTPNWYRLNAYQEQALELIAMKIARILNGDADYEDNWRDVAGYATLVADQLKEVRPDGGFTAGTDEPTEAGVRTGNGRAAAEGDSAA